MRRLAALVVCACVLAACTGGGGGLLDRAGQSDETATTTTTSLVLEPGQVLHHVGATFEYGGFLVTIGDTVWDPEKQELIVGARFRNLGDTWKPTPIEATLDAGSAPTNLLVDTIASVPPQMTADVTFGFYADTESDPTDTGTITWGKADESQPVIQLASGEVDNGWIAAPVAIDGWARIGAVAVHVTGGELLAGELNMGRQAPAGKRILRLDFDQYSAVASVVNGFFPTGHLTLKGPDGAVVEGVDSSEGVLPASWTATAGNWIEFPVSDDPAGDYTLLLSSLDSHNGFLLHPELVERVPMPFHLDDVKPGAAPDEPPPQPVVADDSSEPAGEPVAVDLDVGSVNVTGFAFTPRRLTWDPNEEIATVTGDATSLERDDATKLQPTDPVAAATGLFDIDPQFSFNELLVSAGNSYSGVVDEDATVPLGTTKEITIEFLSVRKLDPEDAALYIGDSDGVASSIPLGPNSTVPLYPPTPDQQLITADPVTAGYWTVQLLGYRVGLLDSTRSAPPGQRQLEIVMDVTASTAAQPKALGLGFGARTQLFMALPDGYMLQAVSDSGAVLFNPGETHRASAVFLVPDSFGGGQVGFVLRSLDEIADVFPEQWVETTFAAQLGTAASTSAGGSL